MKNSNPVTPVISYACLASPIGKLRLLAINDGLLAVDHPCQQQKTATDWMQNEKHPLLRLAIIELGEYFDGKRRKFSTPLAPRGTPFQRKVWQALQTIPYGETRSYSEIAQLIDNPRAVRAVGAANGKNPLSIFIPCHRVIGKAGNLTGYAGGMATKHTLLDTEVSFAH